MSQQQAVKKMAQKPQAHAHFLIVKTARDMAAVAYEELMKNNDWYTSWKAQHPDLHGEPLQLAFILKAYPLMLEQARHTLTEMLSQPIAEALKEEIADALIKDNSLKRGRAKRWA